jgi:ankyrin repeat protein
MSGYIKVVELLLNDPKVDVNTKDAYGITPFGHAATEGHEAVVRRLIA